MLSLRIGTYQFKGQPPRSYQILSLLFVTHFGLLFSLVMSVDYWASRSRDEIYSYPLPMRTPVRYFAPPFVGNYMQYGPIGAVLLACILLGILWRHSGEVENIAARPKKCKMDDP